MEKLESAPVLEFLDEKTGVTTREVAAEFDVDFLVAQNALRRLYMDDSVEIEEPSALNENKRWKAR